MCWSLLFHIELTSRVFLNGLDFDFGGCRLGFYGLWNSEAEVLNVFEDLELVLPDLLELLSFFEQWLLKQCLDSWSLRWFDSETLVNEILVGVREGCLNRVFFSWEPVELFTVVVLEHFCGRVFLAEERSSICEVISEEAERPYVDGFAVGDAKKDLWG